MLRLVKIQKVHSKNIIENQIGEAHSIFAYIKCLSHFTFNFGIFMEMWSGRKIKKSSKKKLISKSHFRM